MGQLHDAPAVPRRRRPQGEGEGPFKARLRRLVAVARSHRRALVLTHDNPDPDAVASACGLTWLLHKSGVEAQAAYGGVIGRAENKALLKILSLPLQPLSRVAVRDFDLV